MIRQFTDGIQKAGRIEDQEEEIIDFSDLYKALEMASQKDVRTVLETIFDYTDQLNEQEKKRVCLELFRILSAKFVPTGDHHRSDDWNAIRFLRHVLGRDQQLTSDLVDTLDGSIRRHFFSLVERELTEIVLTSLPKRLRHGQEWIQSLGRKSSLVLSEDPEQAWDDFEDVRMLLHVRTLIQNEMKLASLLDPKKRDQVSSRIQNLKKIIETSDKSIRSLVLHNEIQLQAFRRMEASYLSADKQTEEWWYTLPPDLSSTDPFPADHSPEQRLAQWFHDVVFPVIYKGEDGKTYQTIVSAHPAPITAEEYLDLCGMRNSRLIHFIDGYLPENQRQTFEDFVKSRLATDDELDAALGHIDFSTQQPLTDRHTPEVYEEANDWISMKNLDRQKEEEIQREEESIKKKRHDRGDFTSQKKGKRGSNHA